jgi:hypothetical protein
MISACNSTASLDLRSEDFVVVLVIAFQLICEIDTDQRLRRRHCRILVKNRIR